METELEKDDRSVIDALANTVSGMSAEALGIQLGLDKMLLYYRLDKLVKAGLLKRTRPMFMEPELYELTAAGRDQIKA
jgi:predicted ArsR family transcriptional regulator